MSIAEALMTAEEFAEMPDDGRYTELVDGRIIELPPFKGRHGRVCYRATKIVGDHVDANDLGTILVNDAGIITRRNPDTVRGPDVAYFSFERMARGPLPDRYMEVAPELVFEIRSPSNRWREIHAKVAEYLNMGVLVVCILDPESQTAHLYYPDQPARVFKADDELTFPECLPGLSILVGRFFE